MRKRIIIEGLLAIIVLAGIAIGLAAFRQPSREVKLADGSVIRVESVSYGLRQPFKLGGWWQRFKENVAPRLPKSWVRGWLKPPPKNVGNWWMNATAHTNSPALQIWITRRNPDSGVYHNVAVQYADIVDEHGCVFAETLAGGENAGLISQTASFGGNGTYYGPNSGANWLTFEAFPRNESRFKLRLYDWERKYVGELTIVNPIAPPTPAKWQAASIPVRQTVGDQTFILKSIALKTNYVGPPKDRRTTYQRPAEIVPKFEVLEHGEPSKDWQAVDLELWDSDGNFASKLQPEALWLCPRQSTWKLVAKFCGSEHAPSASNTFSVLRGLKIPAPGEFTDVVRTPGVQSMITVGGASFTVTYIVGIGDVRYSNDVPVSATKPALFSSILGAGAKNVMAWENNNRQVFHGTKPHIVVKIPALNDDQWLSIRAVDDQGREGYGQASNLSQQPKWSDGPAAMYLLSPRFGGMQTFYFSLDLPADAKTVDLYFCIHTPRAVEFIFQPPATSSK